ncbi:MAG TPA: hypothetical protein VLV56_12465 [Burkholderiales bacterium]|nr:hypothetical protein [Burkholderiales bacterium]
MGGLSTLGVIHTAISLVALVSGFIVLIRDKEISPKNRLGQTYLLATLLTAATALGIFRHGGFGPPHVLAILTLAALAVAWTASNSALFGRAARYVETACYSATFLFHLVPGFTETLTRLPAGAPIAASDQAPILQAIDAALLALFLAGLAWQMLRLRAASR